MGLHLCKQLLKLMGGDIQVTSVYQEGSIFSFWIEDHKDDEDTSIMKVEENCSSYVFTDEIKSSHANLAPFLARQQPSFIDQSIEEIKITPIVCLFSNLILKKKLPETKFTRFLVVDDNEYNLFGITNILTQLQIEPDVCYNGKDAIEKVLEHSADPHFYKLILMDINMPILDGLQVRFINLNLI